ncbi:MAG: hypothetical protein HYV03_08435, partial [Deltaproteobacteria bacterium]|nr:hypothetical protein [Deltaproteobacteria bacterium]
MILTFIIDPPFLLLLGYVFALAIPLASTRTLTRTRAFLAGLCTLIVFCIAVVLSFWWYPDWMAMYFATLSDDSVGARGLVLLLALIFYYLLYCSGFLWGTRVRAQTGRRAWWGVALLGAASALIVVPFFDRYYAVGTTADFLTGSGLPLPHSPLALVYNLALPLMLLVGAIG